MDKWSRLVVEIDWEDIPILETYCMWADNGSSTGIFYLNAFDTIHLEKSGERLAGGAYFNNFMIEKVT